MRKIIYDNKKNKKFHSGIPPSWIFKNYIENKYRSPCTRSDFRLFGSDILHQSLDILPATEFDDLWVSQAGQMAV